MLHKFNEMKSLFFPKQHKLVHFETVSIFRLIKLISLTCLLLNFPDTNEMRVRIDVLLGANINI